MKKVWCLVCKIFRTPSAAVAGVPPKARLRQNTATLTGICLGVPTAWRAKRLALINRSCCMARVVDEIRWSAGKNRTAAHNRCRTSVKFDLSYVSSAASFGADSMELDAGAAFFAGVARLVSRRACRLDISITGNRGASSPLAIVNNALS